MKIETKIIGSDTLNIMLKNAPKRINNTIKKIFFQYGNDMRNYIILNMRNTPKDNSKSYARNFKSTLSGGKVPKINKRTKYHHPSFPGNYPAIDTGALIKSIKFFNSESRLEIGIMDDVPYAKDLELGTNKMKARPFLRPTLKLFEPKIKNSIMDAIRNSIKK
jgi:HK97 gp10 family phage protein